MNDPSRKPSRLRRWLTIAGLTLVFAFAGWAVLIWLGSTALRHAMANADRLDPGWRLSELAAARVKLPPERNASVVILKLKADLPKNGVNYKVEERFNDYPPNHLLRADQVEALSLILDPVRTQANSLHQLADMPQGYTEIHYTPDVIGTLLDVQENRNAARLLRYSILERLQADDPAGAAKLCRANLHVGSSIGDEPFLISQLVRMAIQSIAAKDVERLLALSQPGEADLATLQQRYEAFEAEPLFLHAVRGERAMTDRFFENLQTAKVSSGNLSRAIGMGGPAGSGWPVDLLCLIPGQVGRNRVASLDLMTELVEAAKQPPEQWTTSLQQFDQRSKSLPIMARLLVPACHKTGEGAIRNHAQMRCIIVALASERFRIKQNRWPNSVQELVDAKLLTAMLLDPYDGQPIRIKKADDGLIVYALGLDRSDDGGKLYTTTVQPGTDVGYRLFDVAARRKPALPAPPPEEGDTPPPLEVPPPADPKP